MTTFHAHSATLIITTEKNKAKHNLFVSDY